MDDWPPMGLRDATGRMGSSPRHTMLLERPPAAADPDLTGVFGVIGATGAAVNTLVGAFM